MSQIHIYSSKFCSVLFCSIDFIYDDNVIYHNVNYDNVIYDDDFIHEDDVIYKYDFIYVLIIVSLDDRIISVCITFIWSVLICFIEINKSGKDLIWSDMIWFY